MDAGEPKKNWTVAAAVALLRWGLGLLFLFASLGKFYYQGKWSFENAKWFVTGYLLEDKMRESFFPKWLISAYGYALPYFEIIIALLLLLGIARDKVLFAAGLLIITLTIGAMQTKDYTVVLENFFYLFICATLLFASRYDLWILRPCKREKKNGDCIE